MDPAISLNLNTTLGAIQIGVLVSYVLFGVSTTQTSIYYSRFPDDSRKLKALVAFVWICEVGHALCIGHSLYVYTISDYAHPERVLGPTPKSLETTSIFSGVIAACGDVGPSLIGMHCTLCCGVGYEIGQWIRNAVGVARQLCLEHQHYERCDDYDNVGDPPPQSTRKRAHENSRTRGKTHFVEHRDWDIDKFVAMKENFIWVAFWVVGARGEGVSRDMALNCNFNHTSLEVFSNSLLASLNSRATLRALNEVTVPVSLPSLMPAVALPSHSVQITKVTRIASNAEPSHVQSDKFLPEDV
ncbi:hypothetical protein B0H13DRAFT_1868919 [Mycena leptocephala]|nr:hypothetical protein B0H13DRAFT_1868919 [Mycena leptocephala]